MAIKTVDIVTETSCNEKNKHIIFLNSDQTVLEVMLMLLFCKLGIQMRKQLTRKTAYILPGNLSHIFLRVL